jgi:DNA-binding YbaB/EbfC family protein
MFGGNMAKMMQKAQEMQKNMKVAGEEVKNLVATGISGNEIKITINGEYQVQNIEIADGVLGDKEMLSDMLMLAFNDATTKIKNESEKIMSGATGGMKLPF